MPPQPEVSVCGLTEFARANRVSYWITWRLARAHLDLRRVGPSIVLDLHQQQQLAEIVRRHKARKGGADHAA
jgi:hypothetical protein